MATSLHIWDLLHIFINTGAIYLLNFIFWMDSARQETFYPLRRVAGINITKSNCRENCEYEVEAHHLQKNHLLVMLRFLKPTKW